MSQKNEGVKNWVGDFNTDPVFRDGLSSMTSYLIVATKKESDRYSCVCMRSINSEVNVKFYPSVKFWGLDKTSLKDLGFNVSTFGEREAQKYERVYLPKSKLDGFLAYLKKDNGNLVAVSAEACISAMNGLHDASVSRELHPIRGGATPEKPFIRDKKSSFVSSDQLASVGL